MLPELSGIEIRIYFGTQRSFTTSALGDRIHSFYTFLRVNVPCANETEIIAKNLFHRKFISAGQFRMEFFSFSLPRRRIFVERI